MSANPDTSWHEPGSLLPLRWGSYPERYLAGLGLIFSGGIGLQGANTHVLWLLLLGSLTHVAGWWVLPAPGSRRVWASVLGLIGIWLPLTGPQSLAVLALPFLGWLLVRQRPAISHLAVLPVAGVGVLLALVFTEYSQLPLALGIMVATVVLCAWLARFMASFRRTPSNNREVIR